MKARYFRISAFVSMAIFLSLLLAVSTAQAACSISSVFVDKENSLITINGQNFTHNRNSEPVVQLANTPLTVNTSNDTQITVGLPAEVSDGDYLLTVYNLRNYCRYNLTIGATGSSGSVTKEALCQIYSREGFEAPPFCRNLVFVTSQIYTGNLGGIAGADDKCNERAKAAGLPGTYKAWISAGSESPASRFVKSNLPYKRTSGTIVAMNWEDLIDGVLIGPIFTNEYGNTAASVVWTNTNTSGSSAGANSDCSQWISADGGLSAVYGETALMDAQWTQSTRAGVISCAMSMSLYCFQQ